MVLGFSMVFFLLFGGFIGAIAELIYDLFCGVLLSFLCLFRHFWGVHSGGIYLCVSFGCVWASRVAKPPTPRSYWVGESNHHDDDDDDGDDDLFTAETKNIKR